MASADHRVVNPPAYFFAALILTIVVGLAFPTDALDGRGFVVVGGLLSILGVWLNVAGSRQFDHAGTPIRPGSKGGALVVDGVFQISRNPMYLGMALVLVGAALVFGSAPALAVTPVFVGCIDGIFVTMEEQILMQEFGDEYEVYRNRVRRWI
jgi:protein-S-isoprenylcysteine O-methyltransferase Ste14